jgi:hypothetical protein
MRHVFTFCSVLLTLAASLGCNNAPSSDYSKLGLVNARGKVTLDGQPLAKAVISFDAEDGQFSYGLTDAGGNYTLQLDSEKRGVTPGKKIVRISTTRKILGLNTGEGEGEGDGGEGADGKPLKSDAKELVPDKYYKKSELTVEVTSGKTVYDFDLKSN